MAQIAQGLYCLACNGELWDNRATKTNPKGPDFKCKNKSCASAFWFKNGQLSAPKQPPVPTIQAQGYTPKPQAVFSAQNSQEQDRQKWIQWGQSLNLAVQVRGTSAKPSEIQDTADKFFAILSNPPWIRNAPVIKMPTTPPAPSYSEPSEPPDWDNTPPPSDDDLPF